MTTITSMIRYTKGDIFDAQTDAIVNTVNTVGVMGKGIALQFKQRFPANFKAYKQVCDAGTFQVGDLLITESNSLFFKYIINFPTKKHWRNPSEYAYIEAGLATLLAEVNARNIHSVAIPPLGAGNGKLEWNKVRELLERYLSQAPQVDWLIYEPQARFGERDKPLKKQAHLTPVRALLLRAFESYEQVDGSLNLLVSQKLAYFLQRLGEPLHLTYQKGWYGPYAPILNKVLQAINGTYLTYDASQDKPDMRLHLIPEKAPEIAAQWDRLSPDQKNRAKLLGEFIQGFETPFSLELLATVDWILQAQPHWQPAQIHQEIGNWTRRKAELIRLHHVQIAFGHLQEYQGKFHPLSLANL